jgi:hypothetical protein
MRHFVEQLTHCVYSRALEWAHSICIAHTFYIITILQYGHIEDLAILPTSLRVSIMLSSAVSSIVQVRISLDTSVGTNNQIYPLSCALPIVFAGFLDTHILPSFAGFWRSGDWGLVHGRPLQRRRTRTSSISIKSTGGQWCSSSLVLSSTSPSPFPCVIS